MSGVAMLSFDIQCQILLTQISAAQTQR